MKTVFLKTIVVVVCFGLACSGAWAQNKTQAYYNSHESEILPDARTAFKNGDYDRAVELCRWHWIIVGDHQADSIRDMAERCGQISQRMTDLRNEGKTAEAKEVAQALLAINPDDVAAKQLLQELAELEPVDEPGPQPEDTVAVSVPPVTVDEPVVENPVEDVDTAPYQPVTPVTPMTQPVQKPQSKETSMTKFVVKAGATVLDLNQFAMAPGGSIGLYDMGGSPFGLEAGLYFGSGLADHTASMFGMDAGLVLRIGKSMYPKAMLGFFSCKSSDTGSGTNGLCGGASLTFIAGGHFCIEVGAKYYPKVKVSGTQTFSTGGASYDFPTPVEVLAGGIAPVVSLGWAF